jgi:hypothetical protein
MINQFEDLMGIVTEPTGNVFIDKIKNKNICYSGGGGGGGQTSTSGIPAEFKPYVTRGLADAEAARTSGALSYVADLTPEQRESQEKQLELGRETLPGIAEESTAARGVLGEASRGEGIFGTKGYSTVAEEMEPQLLQLAQMTRGAGQTQAGLSGGLGSAKRQAMIEGNVLDKSLSATAGELEAQRLGRTTAAKDVIGSGTEVGAQSSSGAALIERVGTALQQQDQAAGDSEYQGLQRFFSLLGSPAVGSETTTTSSGGGK